MKSAYDMWPMRCFVGPLAIDCPVAVITLWTAPSPIHTCVVSRRLSRRLVVPSSFRQTALYQSNRCNACSLLNKLDDLRQRATDYGVDIIAVSETWATGELSDAELSIDGYMRYSGEIGSLIDLLKGEEWHFM